MLNVPESIKSLYKRDCTRKNFRAHFPNGELPDITNRDCVRESLKFTESVCSRNVFRFGLAESSVIEFETVGIGNMYGMRIECSIEIDTGDLSAAEIAEIQAGTWDGTLVLPADSDIGFGFFRIPLGVFDIKSCPRNHEAMTHRRVTAYSPTFGDSMRIPALSPFPSMNISVNAIAAMTTGEGITEIEGGIAGRTGQGLYLFDSSGTFCDITIRNITAAGILSTANVDFVSCSGFAPAREYRKVGDAVAAALDAAGWDLTYNRNRKKIYESNRDALLSACPALFSPVVKTNIAYSFPTYANGGSVGFCAAPITNGTLIPVPYSAGNEATQNRAFTYSGGDPNYFIPVEPGMGYVARHYVEFVHLAADDTFNVHIERDGVDTYVTAYPHAQELPNINNSAIHAFQLNEIGNRFAIQNSGSGAEITLVNDEISPTYYRTDAMYSYERAADLSELAQGAAELRGEMWAAARDGSTRRISLDTSSPITIQPQDYSEFWWDEYDISPIGQVILGYRAGDTDSTATVEIGDGRSVYDMTDNALAQRMADQSLAGMSALLASPFAQNAQLAAFTPAELTMQGWPWMEAGDAIQITTDGQETVETFALRIELSGIQQLTSVITADGGEIIEEE